MERKKKKRMWEAKQCMWAIQEDIIERKRRQCLADVTPVIKKAVS